MPVDAHARPTTGATGVPDEPTASVPDGEVDIPTQSNIPLTDPWTPVYCSAENEYFLEKCFQQDGDKLLDAFTRNWPELTWKCAKDGENIGQEKISDDRLCHAGVRYTDVKSRASFDVSYDLFLDTDKVQEIRMVASARAFADEGEKVSKKDVRDAAQSLNRVFFKAMLPGKKQLLEQIDRAAAKIRSACAKSDSLAFEAKADLPIGYRLSCQGTMPISVEETTVTSYTMSMKLVPLQDSEWEG